MSTTATAEAPTTTKLSQLEQLKQFTKVVADTGDFESIGVFKPQDATTNPSLIYAATQKPEYSYILEKVIADRKSAGLTGAARIEDIIDHVLVAYGREILEIVPGRVSTETDARLSFDVAGSIAKARHLIEIYESLGTSRPRPHQNRLDLGRHPRRRNSAKGRHSLQPDPALFPAASRPLRRGQGPARFSLRRPDLRLV
jgi:transaldolase